MKILTPLTKSAILCSLSVLLALGSFSRSLGQVSAAGSLAGTVVDPRGAVVVGAIVTVKNDATNQGFNRSPVARACLRYLRWAQVSTQPASPPLVSSGL